MYLPLSEPGAISKSYPFGALLFLGLMGLETTFGAEGTANLGIAGATLVLAAGAAGGFRFDMSRGWRAIPATAAPAPPMNTAALVSPPRSISFWSSLARSSLRWASILFFASSDSLLWSFPRVSLVLPRAPRAATRPRIGTAIRLAGPKGRSGRSGREGALMLVAFGTLFLFHDKNRQTDTQMSQKIER